MSVLVTEPKTDFSIKNTKHTNPLPKIQRKLITPKMNGKPKSVKLFDEVLEVELFVNCERDTGTDDVVVAMVISILNMY